jgi:transcriptional regulator with XRE-family HTH domain
MSNHKSGLNLALKVAILRTRRSQRAIAQDAGIPETRLSQIVNARVIATVEERRALARVLDQQVSSLFDEQGAAHP